MALFLWGRIGIPLKEPALEELEDADNEEEEAEMGPLCSVRGAFMDLLEASLLMLHPFRNNLFLWISGVDVYMASVLTLPGAEKALYGFG